MTSPNPENQTETRPPRRLWVRLVRRTSIGLGVILLVGVGGGAWWLRKFVQNDLGALVEKSITAIVNRPVQVGRVERFTLNGLRFGSSSLPATPTDPDRASVQAVDVAFDPLRLVFTRTLNLELTLVNPDVYVEQNQKGEWISTNFTPQPAGPIAININKVQLSNANVALVPKPRRINQIAPNVKNQAIGSGSVPSSTATNAQPPEKVPVGRAKLTVGLSRVNGTAQFFDSNQLISLELGAQMATGGTIAIQGETRPKTAATNLQLRAQNVLGADVTRLIELPLEIQTGRVDGNLTVQQRPNQQQPALFGTANLRAVTAQFDQIPQPFINSQGMLRFQGTQIGLENVSTSYGKIPVIANGGLDTLGAFNLVARVNGVTVANARETLGLTLPVPVTGVFRSDLRITGPILKPILSGTVVSIRPVRVDRVDFSTIRARFEFPTAALLLNLRDILVVPAVGGQVTGSGRIQLGPQLGLGFNAVAENVPGDALARLYGVSPQIRIGTISAKAQVSGSPTQPRTVVDWQAPQATYPATGQIVIAGTNSFLLRNTTLNVAGGTVQAAAQLVGKRWQAEVQASQLRQERLLSTQAQNVSLRPGQLNGRAFVSGTIAPFTVGTNGTSQARVQVAGGNVAVSNIQVIGDRWQAQIQANSIRLGRILAQALPALQEPLTGTFQVAGSTASFQPETIRASGWGQLNVAGGTVTASNVTVAQGQWQALVQAAGVQVSRLAQVPAQLRGAALNGSFNAAGITSSFEPKTIRGSGQGRLNIAGGTVTAPSIAVAQGQWQAQLQAAGIQVGRLAQVPPQLRGSALNGSFNLFGSLDNLSVAAVQGRGSGSLNVAGGRVTASSVQLAKGRWQAQLQAAGVNLGRLAAIPPALKSALAGQLNGNFNLFGSLENLDLAAIQGAGSGSLNVAAGRIIASTIQLAQGRWYAAVQASQVELNRFQSQVKGRLNADVKLGGSLTTLSPTAVKAAGDLRLESLAVGSLAFDPVMSGSVNLAPGQGANLQLAGTQVTGTQDQISVALNQDYRPTAFLIQNEETIARGSSQGDLLVANVSNFPIGIFKSLVPPRQLPEQIASRQISGQLSGDFAVNLEQLSLVGTNVAIASPRFGTLVGERVVVGELRYENGTGSITGAEFSRGASRYTLASASVSQTPSGPQFQAKANITEGQVQDVLTALQIFDINDLQRGLAAPTYGTSADLNTVPVGLPNGSLLTQLRRFSEIEALLAAERATREARSPLPELSDFQGTFGGDISVNGSLRTGVEADFNLRGQDWQWGPYQAQQVVANGSFKNGVLTLEPVRLEGSVATTGTPGATTGTQPLVLNLTGQIGGPQQSAQLRVANFPVEVLNNFVKLPINVTGRLNALATLAGSITNPQAIGELSLAQGTLNNKEVQSAQGSFSYSNARLNFGSTLLVSGPEPITATGSIPYQLPFASVEPDNNQIQLSVNVKNEGLALLNLLTNQVAWENGQGQVNLDVSGTLARPIAKGFLTVNDATISAQALPEPLTDVTGTAQFDFDRIRVDGIQGNFSRGNVVAQGVIPIFANLSPNDPDRSNLLSVSLNQLNVNLKGLYQGGVSGNVAIAGTAFKPIIGGEVLLADGRVLLQEAAAAAAPARSSGATAPQSGANAVSNPESTTAPEFSNLRLTLDENVEVTRPPILNFEATGTLTINGELSALEPAGTIRLRDGSVNLFTTQFVPVRGYEQTATFSPRQGLDPILNIRLIAVVPEVVQRRLPNSTSLTEIAEGINTDVGVGALETVRVQATVTGPASQLLNESEIFNNLELTSTPSRSEEEIVALLGGGFIDTLGSSDSALGIANIAGSALLGNFQGTISRIGNAIGLSELRLYPTVLPAEERSENSTFSLAAEATVDISGNISASLLKIVTAQDPLQITLNYRLNDNVRLRSFTDFSGQSGAVVQYENRF